jgi:hypothetical protein
MSRIAIARRPAVLAVGLVVATTLAGTVAAGCSTDSNPGAIETPGTPAPGPTPTPAPSTNPPTATPRTSAPGTTEPAGASPVPRPLGIRAGALEFFGDCDALRTYLQREAGERVGPWGLGGGWRAYDGDLAAPAGEAAPDATDSAGGRDDASFSGTNTQEAGVDEGDVVETDGEYVYVAAPDRLRIVAVGAIDVVASPDLPDGQHQLLLDGDRLLVTTSSWRGSADTIVSLFDVSDPTDPVLLRRSHLEGQLVASRAVDGIARLVVSTPLDQRLPFVNPDQFGLDEDAALERNREIIAESTVDDWLPRWFDEATDGSFDPMRPILDCDTVAAPDEFSGLGITWIATLDLAADGRPIGSAGVVSHGQTVYASSDNLYVTTQEWDWWNPVEARQSEPSSPPPTRIHQFRLGPGSDARYVASGAVDGRLLNQYSMSEHDGDLRVATTIDGTVDANGGSTSESILTILRPDGEQLRELSRLTGLGRGEQIYAVRFLGDTGYVVTFRQIDPLYVLDLSDPADPRLDGELKIPGYSAYLHPVGDGLLLGVGQDAGLDGRTTGTKLSLFDVSDPTSPIEIDTLPIGGYSEVEWDAKAFLYWEPDGTIVIPVSPGWGSCAAGLDCLAESITDDGGGAVVAELAGRELRSRGVVVHDTNATGCWNPLQRSIAISDELVTIGLGQLQVSDRATLEPRGDVRWGDADQYGCTWYVE